jgi:cell division protein FtsN
MISGLYLPLPILRWTRFALLLATMVLLSTLSAQGQNGAIYSGSTAVSGLHAGWQMGPVALHTERSRSFGAHHLGNTGYGHALTVQSAFKGPWEIELKAGKALVVTDDGALKGWQTEIQSGSVMLNWVWDAAGNRRDAHSRFASITKGFQPFVGVGIAHVDHVMNRDLKDALGRTYHLWSDGTLRDIDEAGDHDGNATVLRRDYIYESDMTNGTYPGGTGRSVAIPAQIGVRMDVSPRIRTRLGIGGWLGLTDNVDDQNSGRMLSGDALATGFFGLGIRLGKLAAKAPAPVSMPGVSMEDAAVLANMDTDGDGVSNLYDRCPGTKGAAVDAFGCPLDTDGDGYADHRDKEVHSPHLDVDAQGVAIERNADGSIISELTAADWDVIRGTVTSDEMTSYAVHVPAPQTGWTQAERQVLMAFSDIKETEIGVKVGTGPDPEAANEAAQTIRSTGLTAAIVAPKVHGPSEQGEAPAGHPHFRVQLGAYRTPDPAALDVIFKDMEVVRFKGEDGLTRVVSTAFDSRGEAEAFQTNLTALGFSGAFITLHGNAASSVLQPLDDSQVERLEQGAQFDPSKVTFMVQLGALKSRMSVDAMNALLDMGSVEHRSSTGWHRYLHGRFVSADEARSALAGIHAAGFPDAFVVGDVAGSIVPASEAEILIRQD